MWGIDTYIAALCTMIRNDIHLNQRNASSVSEQRVALKPWPAWLVHKQEIQLEIFKTHGGHHFTVWTPLWDKIQDQTVKYIQQMFLKVW